MDDILVDGKPLVTLRVVDLKEELKKRGIRSSGTKDKLQQLLVQALNIPPGTAVETPAQNVVTEPTLDSLPPPLPSPSIPPAIVPPQQEIPASTTSMPTAEPVVETNEKQDQSQTANNDDRTSSLSINEENETIKLTIRSSLKKSSTPVIPDEESGAEESQTGSENDSKDSPSEKNTEINESVSHETNVQSADVAVPNSVKEEAETTAPQKEKAIEPLILKPLKPISPPRIEKKVESEPKPEKVDMVFKKDEIVEADSADDKNLKPVIDVKDAEIPDTKKSTASKNEFSSQKSTEDQSKPQRKRRWKGSQSELVLNKGISSDALEQLIQDSGVDNENSTSKVSKNSQEENISTAISEMNEQLKKSEELKKVDLTFKNGDTSKLANQKENGINEKENEIKVRTVGPAKNPESTVLFVSGLVRPYTLMQLKKLLTNTGTIDEDKFWIDKIKSKCYVTYTSVEEAVKTREALHNLKWPQSSPKNLSVEFATLEDIDRCLHPENYEDLPMKTENRKTQSDIEKGKYDLVIKEPKVDKQIPKKSTTTTTSKSENIAKPAIREWDRDKIMPNRQPEEKEDSTRNKKPRLSSSPPPQHRRRHEEKQPARTSDKDEQRSRPEKSKKEEPPRNRSETPVNSLDDLFRKTKTLPHIYWLPLNEEQANLRDQKRAQIEKDRQTRLANRPEPSYRYPPRGRSPIPKPRSPGPMRRRPSYSPSPPRQRAPYHSRSRSPDYRRYYPRRR